MASSIKKNYVLNLFFQLGNIILPLVTIPYVSRIFLPSGIGEYSFADSIVQYFLMASILGTSLYGQREIAFIRDNDKCKSSKFWEIFLLRLSSTLLVIVAYLVFVILCNLNLALYLAMGIMLINVIFDISWFYQGLEDFQILAISNLLSKAICVVLIFILIHEISDLPLYAALVSGSSILGSAILWIGVRKELIKVKLSQLRPFSNLKGSLALFVPTVAISVYVVLDKTMIGLISPDYLQNGYYEQAMKISKATLIIVTSLGSVMTSRISYLYAKKATDELYRNLYNSFKFVWTLSIPICFGLIGISSNLIPWFLGYDFIPAIPILNILSFLVIAIGVNNITGAQILIPTNRTKQFTMTVVIGAIVNFILNLILIPILLAKGAAIASVTAESSIAIIQLLLLRKELSLKRIIQSCYKNLISGLIMLGALLLAAPNFEPSLINTLILFCLGVLIYACGLIILKDRFLFTLLGRISNPKER